MGHYLNRYSGALNFVLSNFRVATVLATNRFLSWAVLFIGIATLLFAAALTLWSYTPLPCMDDWYFVYQAHRWIKGEFSLPALLWSIHNGHRIVIPHLFHLADLTLFQGKNYFLLLSIFAAQIFHSFIFDRLTVCVGGFRGLGRRVGFGFVLFCLFSPVQRENFMCAWEIAYILPFVCGTLAFVALAVHANQSRERSSNKWLVTAFVAALLGNYSLSSGILIWPILLLQAIALRLSKRLVLGIAAGALLVIILRILDVSPENSRILGSSLGHLPQVLSFFMELFSKSWSATGNVPGAPVAALAILSVIVLFLRAIVKGPSVDSFRIALLCVCLFATFNAAMTALGRWNFGIAGRYETPVFLFWCAFGLILFSYLVSLWGERGVLIFASALVLISAISTKNLPRLRVEAKTLGEQYRIAQAAMASGVLDGDFVHIFGVPDAWTIGELSFLARRGDSFYSAHPTDRLGQRIGKDFAVRPQNCAGTVDHANWVIDEAWPGMSISGTVPSDRVAGDLKWLFVADANRRIVGFGSTSELLRTVNGGQIFPGQIPWNAFVPAASAKSDVFVYGLQSNGTVCAVNPSLPIVPLHGPPIFDAGQANDLTEVWRPNATNTSVSGGTFSITNGVLTVKSSSIDTQVSMTSPLELAQFETLVFKAKFSRKDSVELFFGQQVNGRGLVGSAPIANQWVYVLAQVGHNRFWSHEVGHTIRFDPTGGLGIGAITEISEVWGSRSPIGQGPDAFEFALAKELPAQ
jgi:hypothetical protein